MTMTTTNPTSTATPIPGFPVNKPGPAPIIAEARAPLLQVDKLVVEFKVKGGTLRAVDNVSLTVHDGETLGLVGESGCGKSTTGRAIVKLVEPASGRVLFQGEDVTSLNRNTRRDFHRMVQMVFQDPHSSLDPRMRIGHTIREALDIHGHIPRELRNARVEELLKAVGLSSSAANKFPHEFSGGQRQRVGIARALAVEPRLIVADEPVSALDVSVQAQIINLLARLREELNLSLLFISHDLRLVAHFADRVAVMYLGGIVETGHASTVVTDPLHPYTASLIRAVPSPDPGRRWDVLPLQGEVPSPLNPPTGCSFHTRCPYAIPVCQTVKPELVTITQDNGTNMEQRPHRTLSSVTRQVACHRVHEMPIISSGHRANT